SGTPPTRRDSRAARHTRTLKISNRPSLRRTHQDRETSRLVVGVLLGGVLTLSFGWEAVFFVNVPLAAAALILTFLLIDADKSGGRRRTFDLPGALTATGGVPLLVFALVQGPAAGWASPWIVATAAVGLLLLGVFAAVELRSRDPLLPPELLA